MQPDVDDEADAKAEQTSAPQGPRDDVSRTMDLLVWGRKNGFRIGPTVKVGTVEILVQDVRLDKREALRGDRGDDASIDIVTAHGGGDAPADGTTG